MYLCVMFYLVCECALFSVLWFVFLWVAKCTVGSNPINVSSVFNVLLFEEEENKKQNKIISQFLLLQL